MNQDTGVEGVYMLRKPWYGAMHLSGLGRGGGAWKLRAAPLGGDSVIGRPPRLSRCVRPLVRLYQ